MTTIPQPWRLALPLLCLLLLCLLLLCLLGCGAKDPAQPPPTFRFMFLAVTDGEPLAGVQVISDGAVLGRTGTEGRLRVEVPGQEGALWNVEARCPEGFRKPDPIGPIPLRRFQALDPDAEGRGLEYRIECLPSLRKAVVIVRADEEEGLPVHIDGRGTHTTDEHGIAHVLVERPPHSAFLVVLDTSERPSLTPANPQQRFVLQDQDDFFTMDVTFERPRRVRRRRPRPPRPTRPSFPRPL